VATTQRFQRVTDLHLKNPGCSEGRGDRPDLAKSGFPAGRSCRLRDGAVSKPLTRQMSTQMARFRPDLSSRRPALTTGIAHKSGRNAVAAPDAATSTSFDAYGPTAGIALSRTRRTVPCRGAGGRCRIRSAHGAA
jgi:hypothetical protein